MSEITPLTPAHADLRKGQALSVNRIVGALVVIAAVIGTLTSSTLTASPIADRAWSMAFLVALTLCGTRASRTVLLWMAALATITSFGSIWLIAGVAALVVSLLAPQLQIPMQLTGAITGLLGAAALMHPPEQESTVLALMLLTAAFVPVATSALAAASTSVRRRTLIGSILVGGFITVGSAIAAVIGLSASPTVGAAIDAARAGVSSTKAGDQQQASSSFGAAQIDFSTALDQLDSIWMLPARLVPIIGANIAAVDTAMEDGVTLANSSQDAIDAAPYEEIRLNGDGIDLEQVTSMQKPVADLTEQVRMVQSSLAAVNRTWLVAPVSSRLDSFAEQVDDIEPQLATASDALSVLPSLLGGTGTRTYLVAFTTESESRFLGGFVGSYALLTADNGRLTLNRAETVGALNRRLGPDVTYTASSEFKTLYDRFNPQMFAQNWSVSPDLPSNASMIEQLFAHATGIRIDGVMVIDPIGLAGLLKLTGPIRVPGLNRPLTAANAAEYLFNGQYLEFVGQVDQRRDQLAEVAQEAFDALLRSPRTTFREVSDVLGPKVAGGHLMFSVFDPTNQEFLDRLGITGRFDAPTNAAMFSFRNAASFSNKIDYFLHRSFTFETTIDPVAQQLETDVTITLRNDSPASGLPAYVIGNENGEPTGTNGMYFSIYTNLRLSTSTLDGEVVELVEQYDRGIRVYSKGITIPPGGTRTLRLNLRGAIPETASGFRFDLPKQPTVNADQFSFSVRSADPSYNASALGGVPDAKTSSKDGTLSVTMDSLTDVAATTSFTRARN
jgi:hypothetical protein